MENFLELLNEQGLTIKEFESLLTDVTLKKEEELDIRWEELVKKYDLKKSSDVLRRSQDGVMSGYFVNKYYQWKNSQVDNATNEKIEKITKNVEVSINKDGSKSSSKLIEMTEEQSKDVNFLLKAHGFDINSWELTTAKNNIWNVYSRADGISTLYSSKISVKPRKDSITLDAFKQDFLDFVNNLDRQPQFDYVPHGTNGKMLEINIPDLHLGKRGNETVVGENYNIKIAETRFLNAINDILDKVEHYGTFDKVIFPIGNDFFNSDTVNGTTTKGTTQDNDGRWQELFLSGIKLLVKGIDAIVDRTKSNVEVFCINGNHDVQSSFYATMYLSAYYKEHPLVKIDESPKLRKYIEYGNTLIGFSHGSDEGKRIETIMQNEMREAYGRTEYHYFHLGHLHIEKMYQTNDNIEIHNLPSLSGQDAWHYASGYVGAKKKATAFVYDYDDGKELQITSVAK